MSNISWIVQIRFCCTKQATVGSQTPLWQVMEDELGTKLGMQTTAQPPPLVAPVQKLIAPLTI